MTAGYGASNLLPPPTTLRINASRQATAPRPGSATVGYVPAPPRGTSARLSHSSTTTALCSFCPHPTHLGALKRRAQHPQDSELERQSAALACPAAHRRGAVTNCTPAGSRGPPPRTPTAPQVDVNRRVPPGRHIAAVTSARLRPHSDAMQEEKGRHLVDVPRQSATSSHHRAAHQRVSSPQ